MLRKAADDAMDSSHIVDLPPPWERECAMTRELYHDGGPNGKARFHLIDIWHSIHLGIGKSYVASAVMMLQKLIPESTIDKRLAIIAAGYKQYCKQHKLGPVIRKIDVHTFGGGGSKEQNGCWNKASITSNFMMYLEDFCQQRHEQIQANERLRYLASSLQWCSIVFGRIAFPERALEFLIRSIFRSYILKNHIDRPIRLSKAAGFKGVNAFMRGIYESDVFIPSAVALSLSNSLYLFLKVYMWQAAKAYDLGEPSFPLYPKLHWVHEVAHLMRRQGRMCDFAFNPASYSCSLDEDFIGRLATITRCVSPRLNAKRTLQRYLAHIQLAWARRWFVSLLGRWKKDWDGLQLYRKSLEYPIGYMDRSWVHMVLIKHVFFDKYRGNMELWKGQPWT